LFIAILFFLESAPCFSADRHEVFFSKGMLAFNQNNYEEALQAFTRASNLKPDSIKIQYYLGLTYSQLGNNEEALKVFKKVLSLDSDYARVHYDLGVVYYRLQLYDDALNEFERAKVFEPQRAMIYYFKAYIFYLQNKFSESLPLFEKAGQLDANLRQTTHFFRGVALLKLERYNDSVEELQTSLDLDPHSDLGRAARQYLDTLEKETAIVPKKWSITAVSVTSMMTM
jgi:tetratricopeptide (TPR) repeat protein